MRSFFRHDGKTNQVVFHSKSIQAIDPRTGRISPWEEVRNLFAGIKDFPENADFWGSWNNDLLELHWKTNLGVTGECSLPKSMADTRSQLFVVESDWESYYKKLPGELKSTSNTGERRYLFRGQNRPWRLRTSFHRAGRADVDRYTREDIPVLYRNLSARTRHLFNLQDPDEHGAFLNLAQHYGYPTPLLDWTYSPYVAAFFAYRGITNQDAEQAKPDEKVRVLVFDQGSWLENQGQIGIPLGSTLHFSVGEFIAVGNERMIPQQAVSTITNIDDVESYVSLKEAVNKKYLYAIEMPWVDRKKVMLELSYMGITAGTLFPGLDGTCEELRERNFSG